MRFNEVINRIHNGLIVAPSMPQVPKPSVAATTIAEDVERMTGVGEGSSTQSLEQAEIPYVPASQRQKPVTITEDDSIVVVGQTRQKKRKRAPKTTLPTDIASPIEASETESFDFASVPNVLDDGSDHEVTEDSRKKKSRGQGLSKGF